MTVVKDLVITGTIGAVTGPIIVDGASNVKPIEAVSTQQFVSYCIDEKR